MGCIEQTIMGLLQVIPYADKGYRPNTYWMLGIIGTAYNGLRNMGL